ncbi:MAG: hypothetical protein CMJ94_01375 [Planctomycetes bacterium]|nr:hypothetical protein [Planctomycetota bacterium]
MLRLSLLALLLALPACGMRYSGGSYGGGSFTHTAYGYDSKGRQIPLGEISCEHYRYGDVGQSNSSSVNLAAGLDPADYRFSARIFQDMNGDGAFQETVDRVFAQSKPHRVAGQKLSLDRIEFRFREHHEPIGIAWALTRGEQDVWSRVEMF